MEVLHRTCCGLDVHKKTVVACLRVTESIDKIRQESRTFKTTTPDLLRLLDWLMAADCTHVAMESTGVYWKPIFNLFEGHFQEVLVVNAQHLKAVPGRKTDMKDAEWIAQLLSHGLLKGSYVPNREQRELRELTRHRTTLVRERTRVVNRIHKVLEGSNIKLGSVVSDIMGQSARQILLALTGGEEDARVLASIGGRRLRATADELADALTGSVSNHTRFLLRQHLSQVQFLERCIESTNDEIEERLRPFALQVALLDGIPGINRRLAEVLLAEIGTDFSRFPTSAHLASWAGMCPGNNESAGKRKSAKAKRGSPWLRTALVEAAHGASKKRDCYLQAQYRRLAIRRGKKMALVAVGHSILVIAYYVLTRQQPYTDLGADYFDKHRAEAIKRHHIRRLERLGYSVTLQAQGPIVHGT